MARIIVTDGGERSALAAVRSLGRAGHEVVVAAAGGRSLAAASRYCAQEIVLPPPLQSPAAWAARLAASAAELRADAVLPMTDVSTVAVLEHGAGFGATRLLTGSREAFLRVSDKAEAAATASGLGIRVPRQVTVAARGDAAEALTAARFPAVVKPTRSVTVAGGARKHAVVHVADRGELDRVLAALPPDAFPLLVQERIVGPGVGVFLLVWDGELRAAFAHRRIREKPPAGGVSVYAESVALDPGLLRQSRALLEAFAWNGVAMVEYKIDAATAEPVLMEINGRFWGTLQLAIDAGVDFPRLFVEAAFGGTPAPVTEWRRGVRSRWFWGDMDHCLARLRRSAADLHLPPGAPGRLATVGAEIAATLALPRGQVFQLSDPRPGLRETARRLTWSSA